MSNHATAFSETLVDEWVRAGLRFAFVAPGSRSTPLALALAGRAEVCTQVALDERVAAFMALGVGLRSGTAAVVLTTSGTATTHLHAAVVEAHLAEVPLLVCTADRPPELYDVGAPQTIDQRKLFGDAVRAYVELGVPDQHNQAAWRSMGARAWLATVGIPAGPVQLNASFREPLLGPSSPSGSDGRPSLLVLLAPAGRADGQPWHRRSMAVGPDPAVVTELAQRWGGMARGVLLAGAGVGDPGPVLALAERLGWPVLADPRGPCRLAHPAVVAHADALLRVASVTAMLVPQVVVSLGSPPASKVLTNWMAQTCDPNGSSAGGAADRVLVSRGGSWWDPDRLATLVVAAAPDAFAQALLAALVDQADGPVDAGWLGRWRQADDLAEAALGAALADGAAGVGEDEATREHDAIGEDDAIGERAGDALLATNGKAGLGGVNEPALARAVYRAAQRRQGVIMVSSSMPVRDLEWFSPRLGQLDGRGPGAALVLANRGANGIDGVVATAAGVSLASAGGAGPEEVWVLIGDLALFHDTGALLGLVERPLRLRMVVADNRGGGIFSFLPQASLVGPERFEQLFGTPAPLDPADLLRLHRVDTTVFPEPAQPSGHQTLDQALAALVASDAPVAAVVVRCPDRTTNVALHGQLQEAVARALEAFGG